MKLCFNATTFGSGLEGAIELAEARGLKAIEYSFAPFEVAKLSKEELKEEAAYLKGLAAGAEARGIEFALLNLDYPLYLGNKAATKQFLAMLKRVAKVAGLLKGPAIAFHLVPPVSLPEAVDEETGAPALPAEILARQFALVYGELQKLDPQRKFLLRLSTPVPFRGLSLKYWRALEPEEWRQILAVCAGLGLSYSPGDCLWAGLDYLQNLSSFASAIEHVSAHDVEMNRNMLNDSGLFGPLFWRYRLVAKGQIDWRQVVEALKLYEFAGCLSLQFEDEFLAEEDYQGREDALVDGVRYFVPLLRG
jgi:sugar phosphate isomerase/epimerase